MISSVREGVQGDDDRAHGGGADEYVLRVVRERVHNSVCINKLRIPLDIANDRTSYKWLETCSNGIN
jgi:hypothetical protein